jgi:hypothetical protein
VNPEIRLLVTLVCLGIILIVQFWPAAPKKQHKEGLLVRLYGLYIENPEKLCEKLNQEGEGR